jgi:hypothetical protein
MRTTNIQSLNAQNITGSPVSAAIDAGYLLYASAQAIVTGSSPVGVLSFQGSNDPCAFGNLAVDFTPTHWTDINNASVNVTSTGTFLIPRIDVSYRWIRLSFTYTSGSGAVTVNTFLIGV